MKSSSSLVSFRNGTWVSCFVGENMMKIGLGWSDMEYVY